MTTLHLLINFKTIKLFLICLLTNLSLLAQVNFTTSNLPIVSINTHGQTITDANKITADIGVIDNGKGNINRVTDAFNVFNGKCGIEMRGHSSLSFPKKQYGIELRDSIGNSVAVPLLGMPSESDWVLNASFTDKTFLRNVIAYKLGRDIGRYASRTRYCEVVIDNQYMGLYVLEEKIKRDKNRVDIKKLEASDISGDALTGGYILKIDRIDSGDKYFNSVFPSVYPQVPSKLSPISYIHVYPTAANILPVQQEYIKNYITKFETSLSKPTYNDPFFGYYDYVDFDALVDYVLVSEFVKSIDAYRLSSFLYKNRDSLGGKLVFGPLWDYDISFGLADYGEGWLSSGWEANVTPYEGIWSNPFWIKKIFNDAVFVNKLAKRWNELNQTVFNLTELLSYMDQAILETKEARDRNFVRWDIIGKYQWPEYFVGQTYEEEVAYLKKWIIQRFIWIDTNLPKNYSDIEWLTVDFSKIDLKPSIATTLPISMFAKNVKNISAVVFSCSNQNIVFKVTGDSVAITIKQPGDYAFKIVGENNNQVTVISPEYKISQPTKLASESQSTHKFELGQNYPNPFNPSTIISWRLAESGKVILTVYDMLGNEVALLVNEVKQAGRHEAVFNGKNLASGIYFYKIVCGNNFEIKKMMLLR